MNEHEEWRAIQDFEGSYEVSSFGRVRSLRGKKPRILAYCWAKPRPSCPVRYAKVQLYVNGDTPYKNRRRHRRVHRLVLFAFHGTPPPGCNDGAHLDDNPENNRADNLAWKTHAENNADRFRSCTGIDAVLRIARENDDCPF